MINKAKDITAADLIGKTIPEIKQTLPWGECKDCVTKMGPKRKDRDFRDVFGDDLFIECRDSNGDGHVNNVNLVWPDKTGNSFANTWAHDLNNDGQIDHIFGNDGGTAGWEFSFDPWSKGSKKELFVENGKISVRFPEK